MFHDHYPARGRKHKFKCRHDFFAPKFHDHYPARGRKHRDPCPTLFCLSFVSRPLPRKGTETSGSLDYEGNFYIIGFTTITPQGDGNPISSLTSRLLPPWFHDHYPARGRKPSGVIFTTPSFTDCADVSRPLPRKGTETFSLDQPGEELLGQCFTTITPQGDGNPRLEATQFLGRTNCFTTITPQGDGNFFDDRRASNVWGKGNARSAI